MFWVPFCVLEVKGCLTQISPPRGSHLYTTLSEVPNKMGQRVGMRQIVPALSPQRIYSPLGLNFLIIKWAGKKKLHRSISSSSKISDSVVLDYKHLLLSHSVNLSHLYPMPKKKKIEFQNLDGNHGHKLIQFPHLQMRKMRLKEGYDLPGISVTDPGWGGQ